MYSERYRQCTLYYHRNSLTCKVVIIPDRNLPCNDDVISPYPVSLTEYHLPTVIQDSQEDEPASSSPVFDVISVCLDIVL